MSSDPKDMSLEQIMKALRQEAGNCSGQEFSLLNEEPAEQQTVTPQPVAQSAQTIQDFLVLPCSRLVEQGYQFFLNRPADPLGRDKYIHDIQNGRLHPVDFLVRLRLSREGRSRSTKLPGLFPLCLFLNLGKIPILGWVSRLLISPFILPSALNILFRAPVSAANYIAEIDNRQTEATREYSTRLEEQNNLIQNQQQQLEEQKIKLEQNISQFQDLLSRQEKNVLSRIKSDQDQNELQLQSLRRQLLENQRQLQTMQAGKTDSKPAHNPPEIEPQVPDLDLFYVDFEDQFRGTKEQIRQSLKPYLPFVSISERPYILDLGCGRGEWLQLLAEQGLPAAGVDNNKVMVREGKQAGLDIFLKDAFQFLRSQPEKKASAITSFHLIEHLSFTAQIMFLDEIQRVLAPGGVMILETPNPRNILVGSGDFYRDPTHRNPVFPDSLAFMARQRGFVRGNIFWKEGQKLVPSAESRFDTLQDYVNVSRDYAYIGYTPCV